MNRLQALVTTVLVTGALALGSAAPGALNDALPDVWKLALTAGLFYAGERAMFHIRFGRDGQSFNWAETALVVGLFLVPSVWLRLLAPVGVGLVHLLRGRERVKIAFNALSCATGVLLAQGIMHVLGQADRLELAPVSVAAVALASFVFFLWNGITVSLALAFSQGLRFRDVHGRAFVLNVLVWVGNTALGILVVALATEQPGMLWLLPVILGLLYLAYRSYLQAMQERDTWQLLQQASRELLQVDQGRLAEVVVERAIRLFGAELADLLLVDSEPGTTVRVARRWASGQVDWFDGEPFDVAGSIWGRVLADREPFELVARTAAAPHRDDLESLNLSMCLVAPLLVQDRCIGALRLGFGERTKVRTRDRQVFETFANNVSAAVHNARLFDEMRTMALHDPLTGLPNRTLLLDRLEQAQHRARRRGGAHLAVLFLDLDQFKVVNDSLGHDVGDRLLVAAARRITTVLRPGDTATRFGGDEFVVVCEDVDDGEHALEIAERLSSVLRAPFTLGDQEVFVTVSIGVALATGADAEDPSALLRDADAAMYRAKDRGRARCEIFDQGMRAVVVARLETESDLRRAVERGELRLHYQPTFSITTQEVVGAEALVRWAHPERGLLGPAEFVPLAEETGLIGSVGGWVLEEACRQLATWAARPHFLPEDFTLALNLSAHQISDRRLVDIVTAAIDRHQVNPRQLCLEITESALLDNVEGALETLHRLRTTGVRLALDDFGTGYSSLSYLHQLPVDIVKIDRSFIARIGSTARDRAVLGGMLDLAHALDLTVVAEGVETPAQLAELQALECDVAQGWYFAQPQAASEVESALASATVTLT
ncbi:MAG TPA: EAL domain-containing protein [Acidimicrobiales bacterium]